MLRFTVGCKGIRLPGPPSARADHSSVDQGRGWSLLSASRPSLFRVRRAGGGGQGTRPGSHGDPLFSTDLVSRATSGLSREILERCPAPRGHQVELPNRAPPVQSWLQLQ